MKPLIVSILPTSWEEVWSLAIDLGVGEFSFSQKEQFKTFYKHLTQHNQFINLTRLIDLDKFLTYHFLDTCVLALYLSQYDVQTKYLDLGTGCGVPGILLSIMKPLFSSTCVDSIGKKTNFLQSSVENLNIQNRVSVINDRSENLANKKSFKQQFEVITARAFAKPPTTVDQVIPFLNKKTGIFLSQTSASLSTDSDYQKLLSQKYNSLILNEYYYEFENKPRYLTVIARNTSKMVTSTQ